MDPKYHKLLNTLRPYIVCHPKTLKHANLNFMQTEILAMHQYNPLVLSSRNFIESLMRLDQLSFGPGGMGMPKWVLFDCALIPGFIIGFGTEAQNLSQADRLILGCKDNDFVPLSMYIAIPNATTDSWFGHNLSSLNHILEHELTGLGLLTKYYALGVMGIEKLIGATQWDSNALGLHLKLSPMKLLASYVPIHTHENTLCYESSEFYSEEKVFSSAPIDYSNFEQVSADKPSIQKMQSEIEGGAEIWLVGKDVKRSVFFLDRRQY